MKGEWSIVNLAAISESQSPARTQVLELSALAESERGHEPTADLDERVQCEEFAELAGDVQQPVKPHGWHEELAKVALLSDREFQVFRLLGVGSSNRGIARHLRITERTAKAHMSQIMAKLGVESRLQAGLVSYTYQLAMFYNIPHGEF
ncbi:helix-turn-helix transcriptional regulator [Streptomyces mirabilis]|uniref:helix-turn-helix transcriptional regulator n=1 Tax=Streptomyces mirabilis TaxID=68239 RepID=UPI003323E7BA